MGLQDEATTKMIGIRDVFDLYVYWTLIIGIYVLMIMISATANKITSGPAGNLLLEIIWTLIPAAILVVLAIPSFRLVYALDMYYPTVYTLSIIGNQWYWAYEMNGVGMEAYPVLLGEGEFGLLDTDIRIPVPVNVPIRLVVTSEDVIHSWTIPSLGVKIDAIPNRINSAGISIFRPGLYFGQCSELCGVLHSAMPISLEAGSISWFLGALSLLSRDNPMGSGCGWGWWRTAPVGGAWVWVV